MTQPTTLPVDVDHVERPATTRSGLPARLSHLPSGIDPVDDAGAAYSSAYEAMRAQHVEVRRLSSRPTQLEAERADEVAYATARAEGEATPDPRAHQRQREADLVEARASLRGEVAFVEGLGRQYRATFDEHHGDVATEAKRRLDDARSKVDDVLDTLRGALDRLADADHFAAWAAGGPTTPARDPLPARVNIGGGNITLADLVSMIGQHAAEARSIEGDGTAGYAVHGRDVPAGTKVRHGGRRTSGHHGPAVEAAFAPDASPDDD